MGIIDVRFYEVEIEAIRKELKELPEGHLSMRGPYYFQTTGTIHKGITKDPQKIRQLARKAYLARRLRHLEWNLSLAERQSGRFKTEEPIEIIRELQPVYQTLPAHFFFHPSTQGCPGCGPGTELGANDNNGARQLPAAAAGSGRFTLRDRNQSGNAAEGNAFYPEQLIYLTNSGIYVRSKSERTIADLLDQYGVPYRYEAELTLGSENRSPDFTINRPYDGRMFLWEHFGRMDVEDYRRKTVEKLAFYARHGFFPYDNLICTYEKDLLDIDRIHGVIKLFLVEHK